MYKLNNDVLILDDFQKNIELKLPNYLFQLDENIIIESKHPFSVYNDSINNCAESCKYLSHSIRRIINFDTNESITDNEMNIISTRFDAMLSSLISHIELCKKILKEFDKEQAENFYKDIKIYRTTLATILNHKKHNNKSIKIFTISTDASLKNNIRQLAYFLDDNNKPDIQIHPIVTHWRGEKIASARLMNHDLIMVIWLIFYIDEKMAQYIQPLLKEKNNKKQKNNIDYSTIIELIDSALKIKHVYFYNTLSNQNSRHVNPYIKHFEQSKKTYIGLCVQNVSERYNPLLAGKQITVHNQPAEIDAYRKTIQLIGTYINIL